MEEIIMVRIEYLQKTGTSLRISNGHIKLILVRIFIEDSENR